ncbi:MAG TPA: circadian clock protein KaiC [Candidatus Eisenbacteria bacterium]|nr:circadian clock protein KaiC [Candidatus Eisenbacteria bacterium]
MVTTFQSPDAVLLGLEKCPTGIDGLDEITNGGLPRGRPTLVAGGPGCGKTLLGIEFVVRGILRYGEPGVILALEERAEDLVRNVRSLGYDLDALVESGKLVVDYVQVDPFEIEENGEYDLEGLFLRLGDAIDSVGAKRVSLDTLEVLFTSFKNLGVVRAELRRLFQWLKNREVTAIVTAERGEGALTRNGLEEYVSDCVILLEHRVRQQILTRILRVVKYRGSKHATNEFPFYIDESGIHVLPITSAGLAHGVSSERVQTGIPRLDAMLQGGPHRGSSILITGSAGTGKTTLLAHMAHASCVRGERVLYFSFEEPPAQIVRNMRSVGLEIGPCIEQDLLRIVSARPTMYGLETHLAITHKRVEEFAPHMVIFDPISNLNDVSNDADTKSMFIRLIDFLKERGVTVVLSDLAARGAESTDVGISSLIDTWILLRDIESSGERNRGLYVLKSRGTAHSNQIREFLITERGVQLLDVYAGPGGVLTGSARASREATERAEGLLRQQSLERMRRDLETKRLALDAQIEALRAQFAAEQAEITLRIDQESSRLRELDLDRQAMGARRGEEGPSEGPRGNGMP